MTTALHSGLPCNMNPQFDALPQRDSRGQHSWLQCSLDTRSASTPTADQPQLQGTGRESAGVCQREYFEAARAGIGDARSAALKVATAKPTSTEWVTGAHIGCVPTSNSSPLHTHGPQLLAYSQCRPASLGASDMQSAVLRVSTDNPTEI